MHLHFTILPSPVSSLLLKLKKKTHWIVSVRLRGNQRDAFYSLVVKYINFTMLTIFKFTLGGIKYVFIVV